MKWNIVIPRDRLVYGDFMCSDVEHRAYEEIEDTDRLKSVIEVRSVTEDRGTTYTHFFSLLFSSLSNRSALSLPQSLCTFLFFTSLHSLFHLISSSLFFLSFCYLLFPLFISPFSLYSIFISLDCIISYFELCIERPCKRSRLIFPNRHSPFSTYNFFLPFYYSPPKDYLCDHNLESKQAMHLVMFPDALEHVAKVHMDTLYCIVQHTHIHTHKRTTYTHIHIHSLTHTHTFPITLICTCTHAFKHSLTLSHTLSHIL